MPNQKLRVAMVMGKCATGGTKSYLCGLLRHIPQEQYEITVFAYDGYSESDIAAICALGVSMIPTPSPSHPMRLYGFLKQVFHDGKFDIVHSLINTLNAVPLAAAKSAGVGVRISENLSTGNPRELKSWIKYALRPMGSWFATDYAANSKLAARWLWGGRASCAEILNNPIDLNYYRFDSSRRESERRELGLPQDVPTIGWIGRYAPQKNPLYLVDIVVEARKRIPDIRLVAMGYGALEEEVRQRAKNKNVEEHIVMLRSSEDIRPVYESIDAFVLPSLYEGLPIVAIEAQAMGLPCVLSTEITSEAAVSDACQFVDLKLGPEAWAEAIVKALGLGRQDNYAAMRSHGFDDEEVSRQLASFWDNAACRVKAGHK